MAVSEEARVWLVGWFGEQTGDLIFHCRCPSPNHASVSQCVSQCVRVFVLDFDWSQMSGFVSANPQRLMYQPESFLWAALIFLPNVICLDVEIGNEKECLPIKNFIIKN